MDMQYSFVAGSKNSLTHSQNNRGHRAWATRNNQHLVKKKYLMVMLCKLHHIIYGE